MNNKVLERLKKLTALAERGVGGEKVNAERMLQKYLAKYNLEISDLDKESTIEVQISYKSKFEKKLLMQIIWVVALDANIYRKRGSRVLFFNTSIPQKIEIELKWRIYKKELDKILETTVIAFIQSNAIFSQSKSERAEYTKEELEINRQAMKIAYEITPTPIYSEIGVGN